MNPDHVAIGLIVLIFVFIAVDVKLYKDKVPGNTYSEIIRNTGNRWPAFRIMFLVSVGVLLGHWFW